MEEKLQWIFGLYDLDGDGLISKEEMLDVVGSIYEMLGRYTQPQIVEPHSAAREHVDRIFHVSKTCESAPTASVYLSSFFPVDGCEQRRRGHDRGISTMVFQGRATLTKS